MGQKLSSVRSLLCLCCAILTVVLWNFSQQPWSGLSGTVYIDGRGRMNLDTGINASTFSRPLIGSDYYLGGSLILLFAAAYQVFAAFRTSSDDGDAIPGLAAIGTAILGMIALARWNSDFEKHSASVRGSQQHTVGYSMEDAAGYCMMIVLLLVVAGLVSCVLGIRSVKNTTNASSSVPAAPSNT